jgi:hypothetical protein
MTPDPCGYNHPFYALSLKEFGEPRQLTSSGGWILERPIPGTSYRDGMGCYPLYVCRDWSRLHEDLNHIGSNLVSLMVVTDPFAKTDEAYLSECFQIVKAYKRHFIADLSHDPERFVNKHHRYKACRSLRDVQVEFCDEPLHYAAEWMKLYENLSRRHNISGLRAFSKDSFLVLMQTPGLILVVGKLAGEVIGADLVIIHDDVAYYHLGAYSDLGYRYSASFGMFWMTLKYLKEREIRYFDLGAAAGIEENPQDGLARFKRGWSNDCRTNYFCGRIFDDERYAEIVRANSIGATDYFPAYRKGEFG